MRLIHTSDWHLGRSFHQVGLLDAQAAYLEHLVEVVRAERVDAVLVCGDVYDRALPSTDTVALLSEAVTRLIDAGAQVVMSSGNHDSAIRLGFAAPLLARAGLHIRSSVSSVGRPITVGDGTVYPIPYLEPSTVAPALGTGEATHSGVLGAALARIDADRSRRPGRHVVMAHAFVAGAVGSESERDISVGGVAVVPASLFQGVDYVALGHLHAPQHITGSVRYSGSPLALSFGEAGQVKGSLLVRLDTADVTCEVIAAPVPRPLAVLRGTVDELLADRSLAHAETAWCRVLLTDPVRPLGALERVRARFPHTLKLEFEPRGPVRSPTAYRTRAAQARPELDVCCEFLEHVRDGAVATPQEQSVLAEAVERSRLLRSMHDDEGHAGAAADQGVA
ncbi:MAG: exonuclease SbcCD subunit D [Dermatophilaceae bacterium]